MKEKNKIFLKKFLSIFLITNLIFFNFFFLNIKKVKAQFVVSDIPHLGMQIAKFMEELAIKVVETAIDVALNTIKYDIIKSLMDDTLKWIQTGEFGENGKPSFITNFDKIRKKISDNVQTDLIKELNLLPLCSPIKAKLNVLITSNLDPVISESYQKESFTCTFEQIYGNLEDFFNSNITNDWIAYHEALKPQNTSLGFMINFELLKNKKLLQENQNLNLELTSGQGFLSKKECINYESITGSSTIKGTLKPEDITPENIEKYKIRCTDYKITTPGSFVAQSVQKSLGSDLDFLINSNDLTDFISRAISLGLNRLIKQGLSNLTKSDDPASTANYDASNYTKAKEDFNKNIERAQAKMEGLQFQIKLDRYIEELENASNTLPKLIDNLNLLLECQSTSPSSTPNEIQSTTNYISFLNDLKKDNNKAIIQLIITILSTKEIIESFMDNNDDLSKEIIKGIINNFKPHEEIILIILEKIKEINEYLKNQNNKYNCNINLD